MPKTLGVPGWKIHIVAEEYTDSSGKVCVRTNCGYHKESPYTTSIDQEFWALAESFIASAEKGHACKRCARSMHWYVRQDFKGKEV